MKIEELFESKEQYEKCMVWNNEEQAADVKEKVERRDGADLIVDWNVMYFRNKIEFDHIDYHYRMKISPTERPKIKLVKDLTDEDLHKTA